MQYVTYLVDAHRPAQDFADKAGLPMTVFYHPDHGFAHCSVFARILLDKKTEQFMTWLPSTYSDSAASRPVAQGE